MKVNDVRLGQGLKWDESPHPVTIRDIEIVDGKILPFGIIRLRGRDLGDRAFDYQCFVPQLVRFTLGDYQVTLRLAEDYHERAIIVSQHGNEILVVGQPNLFRFDSSFSGFRQVTKDGYLVDPKQIEWYERRFKDLETGVFLSPDESEYLRVDPKLCGSRLMIIVLFTDYNYVERLVLNERGEDVDYLVTRPFSQQGRREKK